MNMQVDVLPPSRRAGRIILAASVQGHPKKRRRNGTLYFEVPEKYHEALVVQGQTSDLHDALLRAILFSAMEANRKLVFHGRASETLLRNLAAYQRLIAGWWPQYHAVEIRADDVVDGEHASSAFADSEMLLAFSGGLDSAYSLFRHNHQDSGNRRPGVAACLFVHGFDIPPDDNAYETAFRAARQIAAEMQADLIPVRTNLKQMLPFWPHSHGAALAAVLSLFGRRWTTGLIAPSVSSDNPFLATSGYGSTSTSDPLLSSAAFRIIHDVADKTRVQKTELLRRWPICLRNLRVCWEGRDLSGNCGRCSKCLWQMLCMRAVGLSDFSAFRKELSPDLVARTNIADAAHLFEYEACYEYARQHGQASRPEFRALKEAIDRARTMIRASPSSSAPTIAKSRGWNWLGILDSLRGRVGAAASRSAG